MLIGEIGMGQSNSKVEIGKVKPLTAKDKKRESRKLKLKVQRGSKKYRGTSATVSFGVESPLLSECPTQADWEEVFNSKFVVEYSALGARDSALLLYKNHSKSASAQVIFSDSKDQPKELTHPMESSNPALPLLSKENTSSLDSVCDCESLPIREAIPRVSVENVSEKQVFEGSLSSLSARDKALPAAAGEWEVVSPASAERVVVREEKLEQIVAVEKVEQVQELEERIVIEKSDRPPIQENSMLFQELDALQILPDTLSSLCVESSTTHNQGITSSRSCTNFGTGFTEQTTMSLSDDLQLLSKDPNTPPKSILLRMPKIKEVKGNSGRNVRFQESREDESMVPKSVSLNDLRYVGVLCVLFPEDTRNRWLTSVLYIAW